MGAWWDRDVRDVPFTHACTAAQRCPISTLHFPTSFQLFSEPFSQLSHISFENHSIISSKIRPEPRSSFQNLSVQNHNLDYSRACTRACPLGKVLIDDDDRGHLREQAIVELVFCLSVWSRPTDNAPTLKQMFP